MNVCLVSLEYPPETGGGGIGSQTWNKAHTLARLGHTVHVLSCSVSPGPALRTESQDGVTVHRLLPPSFAPDVDFPIYEESLHLLGYSWEVMRHLHRLQETVPFDLINFPDYGAEGFAYLLNRREWNWVPVVVQFHGSLGALAAKIGWPDRESEFYRIGTFLESSAIKLADGWMASSNDLADFAAHFYSVPRASIQVVHCGVDCDVFRPMEGGELPKGRPTVLFVGNIATNKGVRTAFEAVLRLRERYPDILLQIAGKENDLARELLSEASRAGGKDSVEFLGFVSNPGKLPELYRRADVFCSPSLYEGGAPNTCVEAMACGCPVIASTTGGAPEAVVDGQTGLLVPPGDVDATLWALDLLLSDPSLRRRMGRAGRKRTVEYFTTEKYIARVLAGYEETLRVSRRKLDCIRAGEAAAGQADGQRSLLDFGRAEGAGISSEEH